jgi:hypothetical protein
MPLNTLLGPEVDPTAWVWVSPIKVDAYASDETVAVSQASRRWICLSSDFDTVKWPTLAARRIDWHLQRLSEMFEIALLCELNAV